MVQCIDCNSRNYWKNFERLVIKLEDFTMNIRIDVCAQGIVLFELEEDFKKISSIYQ